MVGSQTLIDAIDFTTNVATPIKDTLTGIGAPLVGLGVFWFGLRWILSVARRGGRA